MSPQKIAGSRKLAGEGFAVRKIRLAMCQLRTCPDKQTTMEHAEQMVCQAAARGADLAVLPEMFFCPYVPTCFGQYAEEADGPAVRAMSAWAKRYGVVLVGGTIPEREGDRLYNTSFAFGRDGRLLGRYRKAHLFDVDLRDGTAFRESDSFSAGSEICVLDTDFGRLGLAVCFDLRFPEQFRAMAVRGAELIVVPAQFTVRTGSLHWEKLITMRALDNELYLAGVSAAQSPETGYTCWGRSMLSNPFGQAVSVCGAEEECRLAELDLDELARVRAELPTFLHLRRDLYPVAD